MATYYCSKLGNNGAGTSWVTAKNNPRDAIALMTAAGATDTLWVRPDHYTITNSSDLALPALGATGAANRKKIYADMDGAQGSGATGMAIFDFSDTNGWCTTAFRGFRSNNNRFLDMKGIWITGSTLAFSPHTGSPSSATSEGDYEQCIFEATEMPIYLPEQDSTDTNNLTFLRCNIRHMGATQYAAIYAVPGATALRTLPNADFRECKIESPLLPINLETSVAASRGWIRFVDCDIFAPLTKKCMGSTLATSSQGTITLQRCILVGLQDYALTSGPAITLTLTDYNAIHRQGSQAQAGISSFMSGRTHHHMSFLHPNSPVIGVIAAGVDTDPKPTLDYYGGTKDYAAAQDVGSEQIATVGGATVVVSNRSRSGFFKPFGGF